MSEAEKEYRRTHRNPDYSSLQKLYPDRYNTLVTAWNEIYNEGLAETLYNDQRAYKDNRVYTSPEDRAKYSDFSKYYNPREADILKNQGYFNSNPVQRFAAQYDFPAVNNFAFDNDSRNYTQQQTAKLDSREAGSLGVVGDAATLASPYAYYNAANPNVADQPYNTTAEIVSDVVAGIVTGGAHTVAKKGVKTLTKELPSLINKISKKK